MDENRPEKAATRRATALAHPNIALVKYWGKRDAALNLPAAGSLSITLDRLTTTTEVAFDPALHADELTLDGAPAERETARVRAFLDLVRARAGISEHARVTSDNDFPTAAGLASSASGFAALALAATTAAGLASTPQELSELARRGSGSAARSIFGGFVAMDRGHRPDGADAIARPVASVDHWPLAVVIAVTSRGAKAVGSGPGMETTRSTSPFYGSWITAAETDAADAEKAVLARDFAALAAIGERSCLAMHAVMLSARPGLIYLTGATVDCLHLVRELRERHGRGVFFTVDAGPQVKAVCLPGDADAVGAALRDVPGVVDVIVTGLGGGARLSRKEKEV